MVRETWRTAGEGRPYSLKKGSKKLLLLSCSPDRGHGPDVSASARHKSLFASFSSEKEDSFLML
jgi:hypothetical protein